jgi:hypothetical protein
MKRLVPENKLPEEVMSIEKITSRSKVVCVSTFKSVTQAYLPVKLINCENWYLHCVGANRLLEIDDKVFTAGTLNGLVEKYIKHNSKELATFLANTIKG